MHPLIRKLKVILIFYRDIVSYNIIFTLIACYWYFHTRASATMPMFWSKVLGFLFIAYIFYEFHKQKLYFYHNLGFGTKDLIFIAVFSDILSFTIIFSVFRFFLYWL
ncbi:hypothetical protein QQ008_04715 [Fulvivirgaceae bacterium BMA10]|uniref:Uncharacterized protein n=1 Tax=Splendidivirga corallicola TaxID=3051826 RepID=A0ABT8KIV2_9BACT|nr:hypothetical protein [Fulvivirgaceae bacterium BMA10]